MDRPFFRLEQGWHIYWVNPGDSGEAPRVQWNFPKGFRAGDIRWPAPVRLVTGTVIDYGYQGRVLLSVPLQVPADYKPGAPDEARGRREISDLPRGLHSRQAHAALQLRPANSAITADAAATRRLFEDARGTLAQAFAGEREGRRLSDNGKNFVLSLETGSPEAKASFFPLEEDQLDNDAPQSVTSAGTQIQITLKKSDQLHKPIPCSERRPGFRPRSRLSGCRPGSSRATDPADHRPIVGEPRLSPHPERAGKALCAQAPRAAHERIAALVEPQHAILFARQTDAHALADGDRRAAA